MKIQPYYNTYTYNRSYRRNPAPLKYTNSAVSFGAAYQFNTKTSKHILDQINPINIYINKIFERSLIASRRRIQQAIPELAPHLKELSLKDTYAWDINKDNRQKYLVVLHGTSQNISNLQFLYKNVLQKTNYAILAPEYRSFGKNKPHIVSQKTFAEDTQAALDYLEKEKNIKPQNICVLGHSFGGFAATQLINNNPDIGRLILVSSIDSLEHETVNIDNSLRNKTSKFITFLFKHFKFLRASLTNVCKTNNLLKNIDTPVDIIHSKNDRLIKPQSSRNLASLCKNLDELYILDSGGHGLESNKIDVITSILSGH